MKSWVGILSLLGVVGMSGGCGTSPSAPAPLLKVTPTPVPPNPAFTVTAIAPTVGLTGETVRVAGVGFLPGATLKLDGAAATVIGVTSTVITASTPSHTAGTVDVIVTNPGGQSGTLTGGYTYEAVTLTVSSNRVTAGSQLSVSWDAPGKRSKGDWIAFMRVGSPSTSYLQSWWEYTGGALSGTFTFSAPAEPGEYEFRYLLDDGFIDAMRSGPVTVVLP
jgi:IPT/TIG domain